MASTERDKTRVQAVGRAVAVLRTLSVAGKPLGLAEISRAVDLNKTIVYRLLNSLNDAGLVRPGPARGQYQIGSVAFEIGVSYLASMPVVAAARAILANLARQSGHSIYLAVLEGGDAFLLLMADGVPALTIQPGSRIPLTSSAAGQVLMADLTNGALDAAIARGGIALDEAQGQIARVRAQGFALDAEGSWPAAIAAPVFHPNGRIVAAITMAYDPLVGGHHPLVGNLMDAAQAIGNQIVT